jgi:hypothetical protein
MAAIDAEKYLEGIPHTETHQKPSAISHQPSAKAGS